MLVSCHEHRFYFGAIPYNRSIIHAVPPLTGSWMIALPGSEGAMPWVLTFFAGNPLSVIAIQNQHIRNLNL
jgi:hypothetical protein